MPSTFTDSGIELIADGEQSGLWGQTTNLNLQIIDRLTSQAGAITLSGTTHTLTVSDGVLSDGQYGVLVFAGSPSGTNTVTISPNTAQRTFIVRNTTAQSVVLAQGSGSTVTVPASGTKIVYSDGGGASAAVVDLTAPFVTLAGTETLTNKTLNLSSNTLTGNISQFNTALSDGSFATLAGTETLTNKTLTSPTLTTAPFVDGSYRGNIVAVSALDIDCSAGNYFTKTISANSTFTFSNVPASRSYGFTLELTLTSGTVTWPAAVKFPGNIVPVLGTGKTHLFMFLTDDGGTRWRGAALIDYDT
jgi:hypothetical protein